MDVISEHCFYKLNYRKKKHVKKICFESPALEHFYVFRYQPLLQQHRVFFVFFFFVESK